MKKTPICIITLSLVALSACSPSPKEKAEQLLQEAQAMTDEGNWNGAKLRLDSLHATYPKEVAVRREAKQLEDSIIYIESERNMRYADSLLQPMLPEVDELLKQFRYEKDDRYEDNGRYVHRLLQTERNTSRCYLQAYLTDARTAIVKSYYYGAQRLDLTAVEVTGRDGLTTRISGHGHSFQSEGWHSVMTLSDDEALQLLERVNQEGDGDRVRVVIYGTNTKGEERSQIYYLTPTEEEALNATCQLGIRIRDVHQLEEIIRVSEARIHKYVTQHNEKFAGLDKKQ